MLSNARLGVGPQRAGKETGGMTKNWSAKLALAVAAGALIAAVSSAPVAAQTCPAPGGGYAGALNMVHDATMLTVPMTQDAPQGNAGMYTAVANTACPT